MNLVPHPVSHRFSLRDVPESELFRSFSLISMETGGSHLIELTDAQGQHNALMAIETPVRLHVKGGLGHYAFSYNLGADARIDGDVGNGVGEGLRGGSVRVRGNAGIGFGVAMRGGTLAVYGTAGDRVAAAMIGGEILARGDVGADVGVNARGGTILIGGDSGPRLGDPQGDAIIFMRGQAESLSPGMGEAKLRKRDELRLGLLLINASIRADAKEFRRIVPEQVLITEREQRRGEVVPNWR